MIHNLCKALSYAANNNSNYRFDWSLAQDGAIRVWSGGRAKFSLWQGYGGLEWKILYLDNAPAGVLCVVGEVYTLVLYNCGGLTSVPPTYVKFLQNP